MSEITPFEIEIAEDVISDLKDRLSRTRWPDKETVDDWTQGVPLAYQKKLMDWYMKNKNGEPGENRAGIELETDLKTLYNTTVKEEQFDAGGDIKKLMKVLMVS